MLWSAMQCIVVKSCAVQCIVVQICAVHCWILQCCAVMYIAANFRAVQCRALMVIWMSVGARGWRPGPPQIVGSGLDNRPLVATGCKFHYKISDWLAFTSSRRVTLLLLSQQIAPSHHWWPGRPDGRPPTYWSQPGLAAYCWVWQSLVHSGSVKR